MRNRINSEYYEAKIKVNGIPKQSNKGKSTFFPDDWDSQKVVEIKRENTEISDLPEGQIDCDSLNPTIKIPTKEYRQKNERGARYYNLFTKPFCNDSYYFFIFITTFSHLSLIP